MTARLTIFLATSLLATLAPKGVRAEGDILSNFPPEFLQSLGYTPDVIHKLQTWTINQEEVDQLKSTLQSNAIVLWDGLWHDAFDAPLLDDDGNPIVVGEYDLDIERTSEGLGEDALHVFEKMALVALSCPEELDQFVAASEQKSTDSPRVGDKVVYSVVRLVKEERQVAFPPLEDWSKFASSTNPVYRLLALEAGILAAPEVLGVKNRWILGSDGLDLNTERALDQGDLDHYSRFLDDANVRIQVLAAKSIQSRVDKVSIPPEISAKIDEILSASDDSG